MIVHFNDKGFDKPVIITDHAKERFEQRVGKYSIDRAVINAYKSGLTFNDVSNELKKYILSIANYQGKQYKVRIYMGKAFIFMKNYFITVYHIPNEYLTE